MTYTLAQALIPDGKPVLEGMCLAGWETVPGFQWDDIAASEQIILPAAIQARAAGLLRQVRIERPGDSPNQGGYGQLVPSPCREVVLHWWGTPVGQSHDGVVGWLRNRASFVSAHLVLSPGRATQILPWTSPSWANGNAWMNANSITLECDPNDIAGTTVTVIEVLIDLIKQGVVHPDFRLTGHRDHHPTECPGTYYPRLGSIRARARTTDKEMIDVTPDDIRKVAAAVLDTPVDRKGLPKGHRLAGTRTTLRNVLEYSDANLEKAWPDALLDTLLTRRGKTAGAGQKVSIRTLLEHLDHMADRGTAVITAAIDKLRADQ